MSDTIPLYHFFRSLQARADFSLGLDEYYNLIEAIQLKPELLQDYHQLLNLCSLLWLKPHHSKTLFEKLFKSAILQFIQSAQSSNLPQTTQDDFQKDSKNSNDNKNKKQKQTATEQPQETASETSPTNIDDELQELYLNIVDKSGGKAQHTQQEEALLRPYRLRFIEHGSVLKQRQLNQKWKYYRNLSTGQATQQINVAATVRDWASQGFLSQPQFYHRQDNLAEVIFLIDNSKAMVAFKPIIESLIHSSKINDIQTQVLYFYQLPQRQQTFDRYIVFKNAAHTESQNLKHVLKKYSAQKRKIAMVIVSDAGTASGDFDMEQLEETQAFLDFLYTFTNKTVWLNPMPEDRWELSSASIIREMLPMFEATEDGLLKAVNVFRGKIKGISLTHT